MSDGIVRRGVRRAIVIAEIGENHCGDWDLAKSMIEAAARAGADIVKFQSYRGCDVAPDDPEREWFQKVAVPDAMHFELKRCAEDFGVKFLSSPFTVERARFLVEELGLTEIKVASSEATNDELLDYLSNRAVHVYLSTGLCTLRETARSVNLLWHKRPWYASITVMHCTSTYPCRDFDANLAAITTLRNEFPFLPIGYSDHTLNPYTPAIARALGATVIEKHFTTDKTLPGTDQLLSADPDELREIIRSIRNVEDLLGSGEKVPTASELLIRDRVRGRWK